MIRRIYIDNYKCLVNFDLRLDELTLLLGPNGCGKTAVVDVMVGLRQLLSGTARVTDKEAFPPATLTRWQQRCLQTFEVDVGLAGDELRYRLEVEHARPAQRARIALERLEADGKPLFEFRLGEVHLFRDDHSLGPVFTADWSESALARVPPRHDNARLTRFLRFVRGVTVCALYPAAFGTEASTEDPLLKRDGSNFVAWYRYMLQERPDRVPRLEEALREVIEGFCGMQLPQVGVAARALKVSFDQGGQRYDLWLDELSDGQRALVALYALLRLGGGLGSASGNSPTTATPVPDTSSTALPGWRFDKPSSLVSSLFLDEPDNYLALAEIQPWLVELHDACGRDFPQAVVCSHHPELIDYLAVQQGRLLQREASGVTVVRSAAELAGHANGLKLSEIIARGWER